MIPLPPEEQKKEAFRLFEDGRYGESLVVCNNLLEAGRDPSIEILAATNLYAAGRYEDAEVFFRDLAVRMPDSSYVHSYLAKVLAARGDESAIAEYAAAVRLDPGNLDAVRSYAEYLMSQEDWGGALPALRRIAAATGKPEDIRRLMRALIMAGNAVEALTLHDRYTGETANAPEYVEALIRAGRFPEAAAAAQVLWQGGRDPAAFFQYLKACAGYNLDAALEACAAIPTEQQDRTFLAEYARLLRAAGDTAGALHVVQRLILQSPGDPEVRLMECDFLAAAGSADQALARYEQLVQDELAVKNDLAMLGRIIGNYRVFITAVLPKDEAGRRFKEWVSQDPNVVSLLDTARFFESTENPAEARSWYYRAYRADFLTGGPEYARFLAGNGDERECEKVMLYILANIRKSADLVRIASLILDPENRMRNSKRLISQLIARFEERQASLSSQGRELLAMAYFMAATQVLAEEGYAACKRFCLTGMDVVPVHTRTVRPEEFLNLLRQCKEESLADPPVLQDPPRNRMKGVVEPVSAVPDLPGLTEQEEKIVSFLRSHRTATEMELRHLLGTRRVTGVVNRLMQKAALQGQAVIEKRGIGENGEIYEYTGT